MNSLETTLRRVESTVGIEERRPPVMTHAGAVGKPLRVLHVFDRLGVGGTESIVLRLIAGLPRQTFEHCICPLRGADPALADRVAPAILIDAPCDRGSFHFNVPRLVRLMRAIRPQIVHSRNWGGLEAVFAARLARVPVAIHSEHGYEANMLAGLPFRQRVLRWLAYTMADSVFAVTNELREYHARQAWTAPSRIRVLHNGVDTDRFRPDPSIRKAVRRELGITDDMFLLGTVGRIVPIKDHGTLLEAVAILAGKHPSVRAVIVGSGPYLSGLVEQTERMERLRGRVHFVGTSNRVHEILNAMDAFILPSLCEGMANTLLEALATGLPVLATDVGGNPEVVVNGVSGCLFSPGDAHTLSVHIDSLLSDVRRRRELGEAARHRVVTKFSVQGMLERYRKLYLESTAAAGLLRNQTERVRN